jgi:chromosome partitioning protein
MFPTPCLRYRRRMNHTASPLLKNAPPIVVFGNEKGGSGKSTMAIHVAVALLHQGLRVGTLDLDSRQATFSRFWQNRFQRMKTDNLELSCPMHLPVESCKTGTPEEKLAEENNRLNAALGSLIDSKCDVIIIDSPGSDTPLSRLGHRLANILVTPMNDSFVDLDLIAKIDGQSLQIQKPSIYSDMVWEYRKERAIMGGKPIKWFIVRNRLSHLNAQNKKNVEDLLKQLERRFAFTFLNGFTERVIYRELFLKGLTLMDMDKVPGMPMSMSHISARQEVRALVASIGLSGQQTATPETQQDAA